MDEPEWNAYLNQYANLDATHFRMQLILRKYRKQQINIV